MKNETFLQLIHSAKANGTDGRSASFKNTFVSLNQKAFFNLLSGNLKQPGLQRTNEKVFIPIAALKGLRANQPKEQTTIPGELHRKLHEIKDPKSSNSLEVLLDGLGVHAITGVNIEKINLKQFLKSVEKRAEVSHSSKGKQSLLALLKAPVEVQKATLKIFKAVSLLSAKTGKKTISLDGGQQINIRNTNKNFTIRAPESARPVLDKALNTLQLLINSKTNVVSKMATGKDVKQNPVNSRDKYSNLKPQTVSEKVTLKTDGEKQIPKGFSPATVASKTHGTAPLQSGQEQPPQKESFIKSAGLQAIGHKQSEETQLAGTKTGKDVLSVKPVRGNITQNGQQKADNNTTRIARAALNEENGNLQQTFRIKAIYVSAKDVKQNPVNSRDNSSLLKQQTVGEKVTLKADGEKQIPKGFSPGTAASKTHGKAPLRSGQEQPPQKEGIIKSAGSQTIGHQLSEETHLAGTKNGKDLLSVNSTGENTTHNGQQKTDNNTTRIARTALSEENGNLQQTFRSKAMYVSATNEGPIPHALADDDRKKVKNGKNKTEKGSHNKKVIGDHTKSHSEKSTLISGKKHDITEKAIFTNKVHHSVEDEKQLVQGIKQKPGKSEDPASNPAKIQSDEKPSDAKFSRQSLKHVETVSATITPKANVHQVNLKSLIPTARNISNVIEQYLKLKPGKYNRNRMQIESGDLGKIDVHFKDDGSSKSMTIFVENEVAKTEIQKLLPAIQNGLVDKGFQFQQIQVDLGQTGTKQFKRESDKQKPTKRTAHITTEDQDDNIPTMNKQKQFGYNTVEYVA